MNEYNKRDESPVSYLDKTDWRAVMQRKLEHCVDTKGTPFYPQAVKSLIATAGCTFPGWNFKKEIDDYSSEVLTAVNVAHDAWLASNLNATRGAKWAVEYYYRDLFFDYVFEFIKNGLGRKRALLFGSPHYQTGSTISSYNNVDSDIGDG